MRAPRRLILPHPRQRGFTLVELLVTVTLGLLVIAGIGQIYTAAKRSYDIQTSLARLQDAGRYAVDVITQDVRRAGYFGLSNMRTGPITLTGDAAPDETCNGTAWGRMVRQPIFGINDSATDYPCLGNYLRGDVLTVRYANPQPVTGANPLNNGDLYIRTEPMRASVGFAPLPTGAAPPIFSDHALVAHAYYVRENPTVTCKGAMIPSLVREELQPNGQLMAAELVLGVEHLQFQFGLDTDPTVDTTRSVNQYLNPSFSATQWPNVVSVRFWILVRDECPEAGYTNNNTYILGDIPPYTPGDNYRRQLYTSTVALRN